MSAMLFSRTAIYCAVFAPFAGQTRFGENSVHIALIGAVHWVLLAERYSCDTIDNVLIYNNK